jgi:hypothetical protein
LGSTGLAISAFFLFLLVVSFIAWYCITTHVHMPETAKARKSGARIGDVYKLG